MADALSHLRQSPLQRVAYGAVGVLALWLGSPVVVSDAEPEIPFCVRQDDMLRFKEGVSVTFTESVNTILEAAEWTFQANGYSCVCTSGTDGKHMQGSLHYKARAVDLRSRHVASDALPAIVSELKERLGKDFDVILEGDHIHVEHDVKT